MEQAGNALQVRDTGSGQVVQTIPATDMRLDQWDQPRFEALKARIDLNWRIYNSLFAQLPLQVGVLKATTEVEMQNRKTELCRDFGDMRAIFERAMEVPPPDHYMLYEVCSQ